MRKKLTKLSMVFFTCFSTSFFCLADDSLPIPITIQLTDVHGRLIHKIETFIINKSGYNKSMYKEIEGESTKCQTYPIGFNVYTSTAGLTEYKSTNQSACDIFSITTNIGANNFQLKRIIYQTKTQPQGIISIKPFSTNISFYFDREWKYKIQETNEIIQIITR